MPDDLRDAIRGLADVADRAVPPVTATEAMRRPVPPDLDAEEASSADATVVELGGRRSSTWWARAAVVVPLTGALVAGGMWWRHQQTVDRMVATDGPLSRTSADCAVYLVPTADEAAVTSVVTDLDVDPLVVRTSVTERQALYDEMLASPQGDPQVVEQLAPTDLPVRILVDLADPASETEFVGRMQVRKWVYLADCDLDRTTPPTTSDPGRSPDTTRQPPDVWRTGEDRGPFSPTMLPPDLEDAEGLQAQVGISGPPDVPADGADLLPTLRYQSEDRTRALFIYRWRDAGAGPAGEVILPADFREGVVERRSTVAFSSAEMSLLSWEERGYQVRVQAIGLTDEELRIVVGGLRSP